MKVLEQTNIDSTLILRPSAINTFLECGAKYEFEYIDKLAVWNKAPLAFGTSIHEAFQINFSQKVLTKRDLPVEAVEDAFSSTFDTEFEQVDLTDLVDETPGQIKDQGIKLIRKYQNDIAPRIIPVEVEQRIEVKFKNYDYGLTGKIDLYDAYKKIRDHKTTSREVKKVSEPYKRQLSYYTLLEEAAGNKVEGAAIDFLKRDTTDIRHKAVEVDRKEALIRLQEVGDAITKGVFIPNRNSFLCTKRFCKYWNECERKHGGKVKE
jgi:hypothetical protein